MMVKCNGFFNKKRWKLSLQTILIHTRCDGGMEYVYIDARKWHTLTVYTAQQFMIGHSWFQHVGLK
jgi:hypothetical protein